MLILSVYITGNFILTKSYADTEEFSISEDGTLINYNGKGGDVVVPEGVKRIHIDAFRGDSDGWETARRSRHDIKSIYLPDIVEDFTIDISEFSGLK